MLSEMAEYMGMVYHYISKKVKETRGYSSGFFALHKADAVASMTDNS